jgi:hypothetical protein
LQFSLQAASSETFGYTLIDYDDFILNLSRFIIHLSYNSSLDAIIFQQWALQEKEFFMNSIVIPALKKPQNSLLFSKEPTTGPYAEST